MLSNLEIIISIAMQFAVYFIDHISHYRFEIRRNSVKSTVRSEIDHFRCKIGSGW